jgi:hypothetical protein
VFGVDNPNEEKNTNNFLVGLGWFLSFLFGLRFCVCLSFKGVKVCDPDYCILTEIQSLSSSDIGSKLYTAWIW